MVSESKSTRCDKCEGSIFEYDEYFSQYNCDCCGWVLKEKPTGDVTIINHKNINHCDKINEKSKEEDQAERSNEYYKSNSFKCLIPNKALDGHEKWLKLSPGGFISGISRQAIVYINNDCISLKSVSESGNLIVISSLDVKDVNKCIVSAFENNSIDKLVITKSIGIASFLGMFMLVKYITLSFKSGEQIDWKGAFILPMIFSSVGFIISLIFYSIKAGEINYKIAIESNVGNIIFFAKASDISAITEILKKYNFIIED